MKNNKRYWLNGGIILISIHALIFLALLLTSSEGLGRIPLILLGFPLALLEEPVLRLLSSTTQTFFDHSEVILLIFAFIINTIQWFILGSIIGWFYGKIINRNKV